MILTDFKASKQTKMGLHKVSKLIEKINVLHDSLLSIDEEISSIEKDLLLNYIRQLYEQVLEIGTEDQQFRTPPISRKVMDLPKEAKPAVPTENKVQEAPVQEEPAQHMPAEEPIQKEPIKITPVAKIPEPVVAETKVEEPAIQETPVEPMIQKVGVETEASNGSAAIVSESADEELESIFAIKEAKELSEKLSSTPINDLNKAMGINDRFLTVNELFGGDNNAFNECVQKINGLGSYEEAKSYLLSEVTQKYDWSAQERIKKAASFISLVQRRFR